MKTLAVLLTLALALAAASAAAGLARYGSLAPCDALRHEAWREAVARDPAAAIAGPAALDVVAADLAPDLFADRADCAARWAALVRARLTGDWSAFGGASDRRADAR